MALDKDAALDEILHRLAHGDARDVGLAGDVAFRRQRVAGADQAAIDRFLDAFSQLKVKRRAALRRFLQHGEDLVAGAHRPASEPGVKMRTAICTAPPSASSSGAFSSA